ncbi:hypothetical protein HYW53_03410 [Candidatus Giovannonibacteria bacterium]|nr:hypothetical protein [Candidatus Giovannonibacteria bacterium]
MDFLIPVANAQTFKGAADNITNALESVIPILFLIATIVFLWGVVLYITAAGSEDKNKKGHKYIIWGLVGLFVMVAVWGLVRLITSLVFGTAILPRSADIPCLPGQTCSSSNSGNSADWNSGGRYEGWYPEDQEDESGNSINVNSGVFEVPTPTDPCEGDNPAYWDPDC